MNGAVVYQLLRKQDERRRQKKTQARRYAPSEVSALRHQEYAKTIPDYFDFQASYESVQVANHSCVCSVF